MVMITADKVADGGRHRTSSTPARTTLTNYAWRADDQSSGKLQTSLDKVQTKLERLGHKFLTEGYKQLKKTISPLFTAQQLAKNIRTFLDVKDSATDLANAVKRLKASHRA